MKESAEFSRKLRCAHFKSFVNLLTGSLNYAHHVTEGMNLDDVAVSNIACCDVAAYATAVYKSNLSAGHSSVCVCAEVA